MKTLPRMSAFVLLLMLFFSVPLVSGQKVPTPLQCGQIIESEANQQYDEQKYSIILAPGDSVDVSSETVGDYMRLSLILEAPTTGVVAASYRNSYLHGAGWPPQYNSDTASFETDTLSERGNYILTVRANSPGLYILFIGCQLRDGTVIGPGDITTLQESAEAPVANIHPLSVPTFGFAGLTPVDFASTVRLPVSTGAPITGGITPTGGEILGYLINGNKDDIAELQFTRLSGNLNLGLVVLSENNTLVFQASLITSSILTTQFTLPSTGEYTIGIFRVDLSPPDNPEPTGFQIQISLNP